MPRGRLVGSSSIVVGRTVIPARRLQAGLGVGGHPTTPGNPRRAEHSHTGCQHGPQGDMSAELKRADLKEMQLREHSLGRGSMEQCGASCSLCVHIRKMEPVSASWPVSWVVQHFLVFRAVLGAKDGTSW